MKLQLALIAAGAVAGAILGAMVAGPIGALLGVAPPIAVALFQAGQALERERALRAQLAEHKSRLRRLDSPRAREKSVDDGAAMRRHESARHAYSPRSE